MSKKSDGKDPIATLEILIAYDKDEDMPDPDVIERVVDECKANGRVVRAIYTVHRAVSKSVA